VVNATPRALYPRAKPGTHWKGGWVGSRASPDGCEKCLIQQDSIPGVAIPTELSRPFSVLFFFSLPYNPLWVCILHPSSGALASSRTRFLDHKQRRAAVGRIPLDELSVRRRDLYLTTHNRQTSMPPVGFESTIAAGGQP